jgi:hypothetical protein
MTTKTLVSLARRSIRNARACITVGLNSLAACHLVAAEEYWQSARKIRRERRELAGSEVTP